MHFSMAKNAFGDDDSIVDKHTDCEHQTHHGQHVQSKSGEIKNTERNRQGERHRRRYD